MNAVAALSAAGCIVILGIAAFSVIGWIVALFLELGAPPPPRKWPPQPEPPAMSDKAFFKIAYSIMLLLAVFWLFSGEIQPLLARI